jgi:amino acid adenylation domain-containing protein
MFEEINENLILVSSKFIKQKEYWKRKLPVDITETIPAFGAHQNKREDQKGFETTEINFPADLSGKLLQLSNQNDLALYMVLLTALKILIYRCTSNENITVLSPIYKNNETEETINDLLSICDLLHHDMSFKELLQSIRQSVLEAFENQDYPFDSLMESLFDSSHRQDNVFPDILCSLENIHDDVNIEKRNLGLSFSFLRQDDKIEGEIRYNVSVYNKQFLEKVPVYLVNVLNDIFQDMNIKISEISFLSEPEKKQLLDQFNNTRLEYPREKSINQLFAEQVNKIPDTTAVVGAWTGGGYAPPTGRREPFIAAVTYRELMQRADKLAHVLKLKGVKPGSIVAIKVERSLEMIVCMLGVLKAGGAYLPIPLAYPEERVKYILRDSNPDILITTETLSDGKEMPAVVNLPDNDIYTVKTDGIENTNTPTDLVYVIYTSGSSGKPKGVMVEHRQVINLVYGLKEVIYKKYSPLLNVALIAPYEFDASAQQIYASLLLGYCLHIVPDEIKVDGTKLLEYYKKYTINISDGTPTHLRLIVKNINGNTKGLGIKHFIIAGEVLLKSVAEELLNSFENGSPGLSNIYGPTETCVDSTFFNITAQRLMAYDTVPIGKAFPNEQVYILDKDCKLQPIGVPGELCITGDGVSRGYLNQPTLTSKKFIPQSFNGGSTMYRTGDLARWLPDGNIEYLGRIDNQVKIRGYRIETGEIENQLRKREEIREAVVLAKGENTEDLYLCAYIVSENHLKTSELRTWLSGYLPDYMVPAYFVKLDRIPLTANGKLDIKAFPPPESKSEEAYVAPRDDIEKKLAEIWSEVLSGDLLNTALGERLVIGIDDNFFELGGHSLKATTLVYQIYKELNADVKIIDIFTNPTIRELAQTLKQSDTLEYIEISPTEEKEYYDLSHAQRRLWILCQFEEDSTAYNIPSAITISGSFNVDAFTRAVQTMTDRHESLRTVFISLDGEPHQKIINNFTFNLEQIDIRHLDDEKEKKEEARRIFKEVANGVLDLEHGPLFRFKLVRLEDEQYLLIYNFHHIINDGWSLGNIHNEIIMLYNTFSQKKENPLSPLKLQYKDYSRWHNQLIEMGSFKKSGNYWLEKFKDKPNGIELPLDHPRKPIQTFNGGRVAFTIDKENTLKLRKLAIDQDATFFMSLLTLLDIFLYRYSGQRDIIIGAPIANRKGPELYDMIGFLVNTLVYRTAVNPDESFKQLLEKVKRETLDCYQYQDYPFDLLADQLELDRDLSQSPLFNFMLAHNNTETQDVELTIEGITVSPYSYREDFNMSKFDLAFVMDEYENGEIYTRIEYNSDLFDRSTIEHMADNFLTLVKNVAVGADTPINELNIISGINYERVIKQFNDTNQRYSIPGITLQELFENQVEQCGEKTAAVYKGEKISYRDLNRKANQLANYLRDQHGIKPNDVMGISMDRSIDMIVTLLGIIKSGGAYLAVDPTYPRERVLHILMDSQANLLLIDKMRPELFGGYQGEIINIHSQKNKIARKSSKNPTVVNRFSDILYVNYTSGSTGTPNGAMLSYDCLTNLIQWQNEITSIDGSLRCLQFTSLNFCVSFQEIVGTLTAGGELHLIGDIERQDIDYLMDFLSQHQIELLFLPFSYLNFLFNESSRWNRSFNHNLKHIITAGEQLKITVGLKRFLDLNPGLKLHNHYGSTEMHVVTSYTLDASTAALTPIPPAGKPISNVKIYILDEHFKPVPIGVWGELFVAGKTEILGYINNFALTDQKLVKHPVLSVDNQRLYRSGDIGRWKQDGNIELRGRKDFQFKVRGFRVELGEIESKLLSMEPIKQCVVVVKEDVSNQKYLVAYVVGDNIDAAEIKMEISNELPQYMIPHLIILDSLPLMSNGKIDRDNLPDPEIKGRYIQHVNPTKISSLLRSDKNIKMIPRDSSILFNKDMMEKLLAHFAYLVQKNFFDEALMVSGIDIEIQGEEEKKQLLKDLQAEPEDPMLIDTNLRDKTLHQLFEDQVKKTPDNIAAVANDTITFKELNKRSNQLAGLLRARGVTTDTIVGIMMERSIEIVVGILAILKAGGAYLPIDPTLSTDKIVSMLDECKVDILMTKTGSINSHSFSSLQNLEFSGGKPHQTASRPAIEDFDGLPIPDRSLVDYEKYSKFIGITIVKNYISLQSTRGCPYNCAYCHKIWPKKHFVRSAENIFEEIKQYYNMGVRRFSFIDDVFNLDIKNSRKFFELILKNGLDIQIYFPNGLRGDLLTPEYMDLMIEAGTIQISFALETASPRLQKLVGKNLNIDRMYNNIDYICKKHPQIILDLFTMHGFPSETEEEAMMTLDYIKSFQWLHFPYIFILKIYPNTEMEKLALENGVSREAIFKSMNLTFHDLPDTLPFDKSFTINYQAAFLEEYFLLKERLLKVLPYQMKVFTESDIVAKYNSYLPVEIKSFEGLLKFVGITGQELNTEHCLDENSFHVPGLNSKIKKNFPPKKSSQTALRVLLLDLSQYFSQGRELLNDLVEPPLGLMYIMTYLNRHFSSKIKGKVAKSRIDFDNYEELKELLTEFKPDLIGIRTLTLFRDFFHKTVAMIRHWGIDIPIIAGGPYASSDYAALLQDRNVDLVVRGEGEVTFTELIEKILENEGKLPAEKVLKEVAGIVFIPQKEARREKLAREIIMLDGIEELLSRESGKNLKLANKPGNLANVFYIPGPGEKQEMVKFSHTSGTRFLSGLKENFSEKNKSDAEFGLVASYVFEPSIPQLFGSLLQGSGLYIFPGDFKLENIGLLEFYRKHERYDLDKKTLYIRLLLEEKSEKLKLPVSRGVEYEAPRDELEEKIALTWAEVLDMEKEIIGINDNFFELGGHSLKATLLISKMHKQLNVKIPLVELFTNPTIRSLSKHIKGSTGEDNYVSIEPREKMEYYALSSAQKRMFIVTEMETESIVYNMPTVSELEGKLDVKKLEEVFIKLIKRHESLRTSFITVENMPVQKIHEFQEVAFEVERTTAPAVKSNPDDIIENFIRPFDLSHAPLLRVGLIQGQDKKHILMVDMHHIISDGTSMNIIIKEFMAFYASEQLPALRLQYKDYSQWQGSESQREAIKQQEKFWLEQFSGEIPVLDLPTDFPRPLVQSFEGSALRFELGKEETHSLKEFTLKQNVTLYIVMLAIYNIFLAKLSSQEEIVVGTPIACRNHADLQQIVGMFINTLAMKNQPAGEKLFDRFVKELGEKTLKAFNNQDYQYEELVEQVVVTRDTARNPLFDVMLALQNVDIPVINIEGLKLTPYSIKHRISKFDLNLVGVEGEENLFFTIEYCTALFKKETIERFIIYLKKIVNTVIQDTGIKISDIEIITESEKRQVLDEFNRTGTDYPKEKTIPQLFEEQVEKTPGNSAVLFEEKTLTYSVLNEKANQLARTLRKNGVKANTIVGLMMDRSIQMLIGIMAILKAGGAYLPLDLEFPELRKRYMLEESLSNLILTRKKFVGRLGDISTPIDIEDDGNYAAENTNLEHLNTSYDLIYVIYTSGSTGKPKGTLTTHYNVSRVVLDTNYIEITAHDRILQLSNYAFDGSVFDIYGALLNGALLVMITKDDVLALEKLTKIIEREYISVFFVTTVLFNALVDIKIEFLDHIRKVLFGGERVSVEHTKKALDYIGKGRIIHVYGPTETTVYASYHHIDEISDTIGTIPIGKPLANTTIYILDKMLMPVPLKVSGEMYIGGDGVAGGYLNNPGLTSEKFIQLPSMPDEILYKTGDLARWLPGGDIEFIGRIDQQIKIRGFRVELGEIESQLRKREEIKETVVLAKREKIEDTYLCAYIVSENPLNTQELRKWLSGYLPDYMIPAYFIKLDRLPLNANGKVDIKALPAPKLKSEEAYAAPRYEIEQKLADIWSGRRY